MTSTRIAAAFAFSLALGAAAIPAVAASSAAADPTYRAPITAHPSNDRPHVGEEFTVRGAYDGPGPFAHQVKIQTFRNDEWTDLAGARVTTRADGSYRVRIVLAIRGVRDLRAVGIAGADHPNSFHRFVVEVFPKAG